MATGAWAAAKLCQDKDLVEYEGDVLSWIQSVGTANTWIATAKEEIGRDLRLALKDVERLTDEANVLDLIDDLTELRLSAIFKTLHLLCNDKSLAPGDFWDRKAEIYYQKYKEEWPTALGLIHVDIDESGDIDDTEKYNFPINVRLTRGGP